MTKATNARLAQILQAATLGTIAFKSGVRCIPCLDKSLMGMLAGRHIGETPEGEASSIELMTEWQRAWTAANIAA